ncbi:RHS repeat-associated core domain-containing protein [Adonisia turfae]|uniref:RHS repeat-associated core domain-containing protein n=1 Tax=Adonisia turfae CCMR0081 TaxID=2292702 RepID=A0A6M0RL05_9CYAN|nr:RHS repeat-associated core domain-containing protein [Adonisia turfae CCMR0081]
MGITYLHSSAPATPAESEIRHYLPTFFRSGYTGRERDDATGLIYYRARYYDPTVGRFLSEDPLGFDAGDANLYRYVFHSPTNYTDPSGEAALVTLAAVGGVNAIKAVGGAVLALGAVHLQ